MSTYEIASLTSSIVYTATTIVLLLMAVLQFRHSRRDSAVRATIALLEQEANSPDIKKTRFEFHQIHRHMPPMNELLNHEKYEREREVLRSILNRYEYIAVGVGEGSIDFDIYQKLWRSSTVEDWGKLADFVTANREKHNNQAIWIEFEKLKGRCEEAKRIATRR